jgi:rubrerythrin
MLVALEAQFEREQAENNRLQELAIEGLTANLSETKGGVDTEMAALDAMLEDNKQALAVLQNELAKVRTDDHKDVVARVAQELATAHMLKSSLYRELHVVNILGR